MFIDVIGTLQFFRDDDNDNVTCKLQLTWSDDIL